MLEVYPVSKSCQGQFSVASLSYSATINQHHHSQQRPHIQKCRGVSGTLCFLAVHDAEALLNRYSIHYSYSTRQLCKSPVWTTPAGSGRQVYTHQVYTRSDLATPDTSDDDACQGRCKEAGAAGGGFVTLWRGRGRSCLRHIICVVLSHALCSHI